VKSFRSCGDGEKKLNTSHPGKPSHLSVVPAPGFIAEECIPGGSMKHVNNSILTVVLMIMLFIPAAMAETYHLYGVETDTPVDLGVKPEYNIYNEFPLDTEVINFDDAVQPCTFAEQVALSNEYAAQGVIFSGLGEVLDECGNFGITNYTSPNFLAFNTGSGVSGPEYMTFSPPISDLTIYAGQSNAGTINMFAYDAAGNIVDSDTITGASALAQMSVAAPGIVVIELFFSGTVACFDDIVFNSEPDSPCEVILDPVNINVPQGGGNVTFWAGVANNTNSAIIAAAWIIAQNMNSGNSVEVMYFPVLNFPPNATIGTTLNVFIPGAAPGGDYQMMVFVGNYPWAPMCWNSFRFVKGGPSADSFEVFERPELWKSTGNFGELASQGDFGVGSNIPSEYALGQAYPNPFNPSTTLSVNLPEASELNVVVYNTMGQQVAELANGQYAAGSHQLTFDASNLSGAVYFVHASANGWSAVQKVVLIK
jgi:Secretion system C-terminal sorting domain